MANNPGEAPSDDFLAQIFGFPGYAAGAEANLVGNEAPTASMMLHLGSGDGLGGVGIGGGYGVGSGFPLGLSLERGRGGFHDASGSGKRFHRDDVIDSRHSVKADFHAQPVVNTARAAPQPPAVKPRARRGHATDPHSIAERLRRERISERIRALQELVPSVNKTDRAIMLDEIVDYVKFLRLQVKVLSMSRMGGAGAVAPLVTDIPISSIEGEGNFLTAHSAWSNNDSEQQVAKLMEENVGAAMQFLQSKALCIMPISLASAICLTPPPDPTILIKHESNPSN